VTSDFGVQGFEKNHYSILFYSMQVHKFTNFALHHIILLINKQLFIGCFKHCFRKD
jgi:hypothetical protein